MRPFVARAASSTFSVPPMLVSKSSRGLRVETTMLRAAAWNTISASATSLSTIAGSHTEPCTNSNPLRGRFSSRPVNRSSSTVTRAPSRIRRRTRLLPMKPAPPVTSTRAFSIGIMDADAPMGSVAQAEPQVDEGPQDAPTVLEAHLRGAATMIANGHRRLPDAVAGAHGLVEQVGLELVAIEPGLFELDPRIVEEREAERAQAVRAVGHLVPAREPEQQRVELGEPAPVGRDARRGAAREPARALYQVGLPSEQRCQHARQLVRLVLVVAGEHGGELDAAALRLQEPGADAGPHAHVHLVPDHDLGAGRAGLPRRVVARVVVDHDHRGGPAARHLADHEADLPGLVPGGHDGGHPRRVDEREAGGRRVERGDFGRAAMGWTHGPPSLTRTRVWERRGFLPLSPRG